MDLRNLMTYLDNSVTCYQAVEEACKRLEEKGFIALSEKKVWTLERGKAYYVTRNDSSVIAFKVPQGEIKGFHIYAAHSDSPAFKIKENPEMPSEKQYVCLNTEKYGGMIMSTWMDRPLTIAGRVCIEKEGEIVSYPVKLKDNICMIPNIAIHMNRNMNDGVALNPQIDMLPLLSMLGENESLTKYVAEQLSGQIGESVEEADILASDLFVVNSQKATLAGLHDEFLMSSRFDDLGCVYAGLEAILEAEPTDYIDVLAIFDNEEVGSLTRQGADSTFLPDSLENIADGLAIEQRVLKTWLADSFLLSADNAHACHPNQGSKADPVNKPFLNKGVVLKYHGSQKYATDAYSAAYVKKLCNQCDVVLQTYHNRSDIAGGSTLGNLVMAQVSMPAADIGLPQLAMHSAYETAGVDDVKNLLQLAKAFFEQ